MTVAEGDERRVIAAFRRIDEIIMLNARLRWRKRRQELARRDLLLDQEGRHEGKAQSLRAARMPISKWSSIMPQMPS